jgi:hypothetical protein
MFLDRSKLGIKPIARRLSRALTGEAGGFE